MSNGRWVLVSCLVAVLCLGIAGAAVGGVFSDDEVGTVIAGGPPSGPPDFRQPADETVLATGSTPVAGRWRLTAYESRRTVDEGVEVEPAGLPCTRLMLAFPPPGTPFAGRGGCGERGKEGFAASSLAVWDAASETAEVILFGLAPEAATAVQLEARGQVVAAANAYEGPQGFPGDVWVMAVDAGQAGDWELRWLGRDGRPSGPLLEPGADVRGQLDAIGR